MWEGQWQNAYGARGQQSEYTNNLGKGLGKIFLGTLCLSWFFVRWMIKRRGGSKWSQQTDPDELRLQCVKQQGVFRGLYVLYWIWNVMCGCACLERWAGASWVTLGHILYVVERLYLSGGKLGFSSQTMCPWPQFLHVLASDHRQCNLPEI